MTRGRAKLATPMNDSLIEAVAKAIYFQWPNTHSVRRPLTTTTPQYEIVTTFETWEEMCENTPSRRIECIDAAHAVIAAIEASGTHAVVPAKMTEEMESAFIQWARPTGYVDTGYVAMLAARPKVTP